MQPFGLLSLLLLHARFLSALESVPAGAQVTEDNGQVTINDDPTANDTDTHLPITATIFDNGPGPSHCRGRPVLHLAIPPGGGGVAAPPRCYNMPTSAMCGTFVANKRDGCQARLFAERGCRLYTNTVLFLPDEGRAVGGLWRSMEVTCGVPEPDPGTLGSVPLEGLLRGATRKPKGSV